jgi:hypothetical protein
LANAEPGEPWEDHMAWWIAGALALLLALFYTLYHRALRETRHVTNYVLLILLDESVYAAQRKGLVDLVRTIDARNAGELGMKINLATTQLAERLGHTLLGTAGLLWKLKEHPRGPAGPSQAASG